MSQTALAQSISSQNRYLESEDLYSKTFSDILETQTIKSPYTQSVLQNYIEHLIKFNKTKQAEQKLQQLYEAQIESLGEDHADTLESKSQLEALK
jgi:hypothetical protein